MEPTITASPAAAAPSRWFSRLRFSIRGLLLLMLVAAAGLAWYGANLQQHRREHAALRELSKGRFRLRIRVDRPPWSDKLPEGIGAAFQRVVAVDVTGRALDEEKGYYLLSREFKDEHMRLVATFSKLEELYLYDTAVTQEAAKYFAGLKHLRRLDLTNTSLRVESVQKYLPVCIVDRGYGGLRGNPRLHDARQRFE